MYDTDLAAFNKVLSGLKDPSNQLEYIQRYMNSLIEAHNREHRDNHNSKGYYRKDIKYICEVYCATLLKRSCEILSVDEQWKTEAIDEQYKKRCLQLSMQSYAGHQAATLELEKVKEAHNIITAFRKQPNEP